MSRRFAAVLALVSLTTLAATTLVAQPRTNLAGFGRREAAATRDSARVMGETRAPTILSRDSAWWVPLTSSVLPGLGQKLLGQDRFVGYLAIEAYALAGYFTGESAVRRERRRYVALARDVARAFVPGNAAVGDWNYYERMEERIESGVFDRTPGTGTFSPETDVGTLNGEIWLLARQLSNWPNPDIEPDHASEAYRNALAYYQRHAVGTEFRWSWRNAQLEWDVFRQSIRRKNDASREARNFLAVVAVNHLLSTLDAFVSLRLRGGVGATRGTYELSGSIPFR